MANTNAPRTSDESVIGTGFGDRALTDMSRAFIKETDKREALPARVYNSARAEVNREQSRTSFAPTGSSSWRRRYDDGRGSIARSSILATSTRFGTSHSDILGLFIRSLRRNCDGRTRRRHNSALAHRRRGRGGPGQGGNRGHLTAPP